MQSVYSRIWTRVAVSIPDYDNHYTTDTSTFLILTEVSSILQRGQSRCISLMRFPIQCLFSRRFHVRLKCFFFLFFFNLHLFGGVRFRYFQVLIIFLFSDRSDDFLNWQFYSFCYLFSPLLIIIMAHFLWQIPFLYHDYIFFLFLLESPFRFPFLKTTPYRFRKNSF